MVNILEIIVFLAVLEHRSNGWDASNGHISSLWWSASRWCFDIPTRFKFYKPSLWKVLFVTSCIFSIFAFFLLNYLAFFPMIHVSGFLFPFLFLSFLIIVTLRCWGSFTRFEDNTSSLTIYRVGALLSCMDRFFKPSCVLSTSTARSLALSCFDLSSCSLIKCVIFLAMKYLNSLFFCYSTSSSSFLQIWSFST